ncbi:hypothetical protein WJX73_004585 [Symbiochloris irregularis]|uniref:EamA domain-containing protein n=1 Tax=Symbiochloris irregularis TaxID=706552 RepID=A0AAW1NZZ4_9CHLO
MIALNVGAVLFGSNQVVIKSVEHDLSPNSLSALRFLIAAVCFSPLAVKGLQKAKLRTAALELGFWLFGGYTAQALGLEYTTAAKGAFTGTFTVIAVPLLVGFSGRKVPATTWAAAVVALAGVGLLTTGGSGFTWGDALCIGSAVLFGVHKFRTETVTAQFKDDTQQLVAVQLLVLAVISSIVCLPELVDVVHGRSPGEVLELASELPWLALAFMGLGTTALTLWIEMSALKQISAPLAALIYTSEPLWGALFAWVVLDERWGSTGWVGAFLIVASSLAAQLSGQDVKAEDLSLSNKDS